MLKMQASSLHNCRYIVSLYELAVGKYVAFANICSRRDIDIACLTERERKGNRTRARKRYIVEHMFGVQVMMAGGLLLRRIGIIRAKAKISLLNLAYNVNRYATLA